jgi:fumarate reductase (CoM/CoB) subunit A
MDIIETEILIIGSGAAGLAAAVYAAPSNKKVLVTDKGAVGKSGSTVGAVQIASLGSWSYPEDSENRYFKDIEESGRGLSEPQLVKTLAHDLSDRLKDIMGWGLKLDVNKNEEIVVSATPGHSIPRSVSTRKGKTGFGILQTLIRKVKSFQNVETWSDVVTLELVKSSGRVIGAVVFDLRNNKPYLIQCKAVILATGGIGQLYPITSNPVQATGDGFSLGLGAGASLVDMEQVQFYPVSIVAPQSIAGFCISFYHFSKLLNRLGDRFMIDYDPQTLEDTTRDKLAIAIASEIAAGRGTPNSGVWLDATEEIEKVKQEFPHEYELCMDRGVNLAKDRAEIGPAAHFMMGGVYINSDASSTVPGLFVAGETAGGLHGGNRLGNNALSECLVFGAKAGISAAAFANEHPLIPSEDSIDLKEIEIIMSRLSSTANGTLRPYEIKTQIQSILGKNVGVIRSNESLREANDQLEQIQEQLLHVKLTNNQTFSREVLDYIEAGHMLRTAQAIVRAAITRTESRGAHYNIDYPSLASSIQHTLVELRAGKMVLSTYPIRREKPNEISCKNKKNGNANRSI